MLGLIAVNSGEKAMLKELLERKLREQREDRLDNPVKWEALD